MSDVFDPKTALLHATIFAGIGFFAALAGIGAVGLLSNMVQSLVAGLIAAGLNFFVRLAIEYRIKPT